MGVIKPVSFLRQWRQTEELSQLGWRAPAGSRPSGEAAKWYKLMKTTLAEPHFLPPPQSGSSNSLPGAFTPGGRELVLRTNDYLGEKGGGVEEVTGTGEQCTPWTETRNNECAGPGSSCIALAVRVTFHQGLSPLKTSVWLLLNRLG